MGYRVRGSGRKEKREAKRKKGRKKGKEKRGQDGVVFERTQKFKCKEALHDIGPLKPREHLNHCCVVLLME